jgi:hypothetical protein
VSDDCEATYCVYLQGVWNEVVPGGLNAVWGPREYIAEGLTADEAFTLVQDYNASHEPGPEHVLAAVAVED